MSGTFKFLEIITKLFVEILYNWIFCILLGFVFLFLNFKQFIQEQSRENYIISGFIFLLWGISILIKQISKNIRDRIKISRELKCLNKDEISLLRIALNERSKTISVFCDKISSNYLIQRSSAFILEQKGFVVARAFKCPFRNKENNFAITILNYPWKVLNKRYKKEGSFLDIDYAKRVTNRNKPKNKKKKRGKQCQNY